MGAPVEFRPLVREDFTDDVRLVRDERGMQHSAFWLAEGLSGSWRYGFAPHVPVTSTVVETEARG